MEPKEVVDGFLQRYLSPPLRSACGSLETEETEGGLGIIIGILKCYSNY